MGSNSGSTPQDHPLLSPCYSKFEPLWLLHQVMLMAKTTRKQVLPRPSFFLIALWRLISENGTLVDDGDDVFATMLLLCLMTMKQYKRKRKENRERKAKIKAQGM